MRALDKPYMRIATGGTTGMSTLHSAYYHVASGLHDVVMAITWEKQSEGDSQVGLSGIVMPEAMVMVQHGMDLFGGKGMGAYLSILLSPNAGAPRSQTADLGART